jgi:hypothetical protein
MLDETSVQMKLPDRSAVLVRGLVPNEEGSKSHHILQVTKVLPFKQWIFDITGPQLNVFDPCLDLPTYSEKYVEKFLPTVPLGFAGAIVEKLADTKDLIGLPDRVDRNAVRAVEKRIQEWQTRSSSNISKLLRRPESTFNKQEEELLATVQRSLDESLSSAEHMS